MITAILMMAMAVAAPLGADTTFAVERGTALQVDNFRGEVDIRAWDRDAVRVRADFSGGQALDVVRSGNGVGVVRVRPSTRRGALREADFQIDVPRWMNVRVEGNQVDVSVRGTRAQISVETVGGDILVEGGAGFLKLRSIQGEVVVRGATGGVDVTTVNEDISLIDIDGEIYVETTNGDISLEGIRSSTTRSTTVNGDIDYDGTIRDGGRYVFSTHNGDVTISAPPTVNATVSISTYHGEFESAFPVRLTGTTRDRQFTFTLGSGSARIELESFNGDVLLRRP